MQVYTKSLTNYLICAFGDNRNCKSLASSASIFHGEEKEPGIYTLCAHVRS